MLHFRKSPIARKTVILSPTDKTTPKLSTVTIEKDIVIYTKYRLIAYES